MCMGHALLWLRYSGFPLTQKSEFFTQIWLGRKIFYDTSIIFIFSVCPIWFQYPILKMSCVKSGYWYCYHQCLKLGQKSCRSSGLESQIINIKLNKNQQKVPGPPPKLLAPDWRTCGNFQHWLPHWSVLPTCLRVTSLAWHQDTSLEAWLSLV